MSVTVQCRCPLPADTNQLHQFVKRAPDITFPSWHYYPVEKQNDTRTLRQTLRWTFKSGCICACCLSGFNYGMGNPIREALDVLDCVWADSESRESYFSLSWVRDESKVNNHFVPHNIAHIFTRGLLTWLHVFFMFYFYNFFFFINLFSILK